MALVTVPDELVAIREPGAVARHLASLGIQYEQWAERQPVSGPFSSETPSEVLAEYASEIERIKRDAGCTTVDVIDVTPQTVGLEDMLARFRREHWHEEDEVRFILRGRGIFYIHAHGRSLTKIEVETGDLIRVPRETPPLVRLVREPDASRYSFLPGLVRMDSALHRVGTACRL